MTCSCAGCYQSGYKRNNCKVKGHVMFTKKQLFRSDISKGAMANKTVELTKYTWRLVCNQ